jgi:signal transduction histidine kinase
MIVHGALRAAFAALTILFAAGAALAGVDHGTADQAKAMVARAVALLKSEGPEKAFAAFNDKTNKEFHDRDLYVYVRTFDGNTVAHGANVRMIGQTNLDFVDTDGKQYIREMVEKAKTGNDGWVDYKFSDPLTHKIEPKSTYFQRVGDYLVCVGIYKG